jgi:hypothetical protein
LRDLYAETDAICPERRLDHPAPSLPQGADGTPDSIVDLVIRPGLDSRSPEKPISEVGANLNRLLAA